MFSELRAPTSFFRSNYHLLLPTASADMSAVDRKLMTALSTSTNLLLMIVAIILMNLIVVPWLVLGFVPLWPPLLDQVTAVVVVVLVHISTYGDRNRRRCIVEPPGPVSPHTSKIYPRVATVPELPRAACPSPTPRLPRIFLDEIFECPARLSEQLLTFLSSF